jgi:hypothetical protein
MIFSSTGRLYEYSSTRYVCNFIVLCASFRFLFPAYIFSLTYKKLASLSWSEIEIFYTHTHVQWHGINKNVLTTYGIRTSHRGY